MRRDNDSYALDICFRILECAALNGQRCPQNGTFYMDSIYTTALARAGRIKVEISGHNYRTVTILTGDLAGEKTTPDPTGAWVWRVIDADGSRRIKRDGSPVFPPRKMFAGSVGARV